MSLKEFRNNFSGRNNSISVSDTRLHAKQKHRNDNCKIISKQFYFAGTTV